MEEVCFKWSFKSGALKHDKDKKKRIFSFKSGALKHDKDKKKRIFSFKSAALKHDKDKKKRIFSGSEFQNDWSLVLKGSYTGTLQDDI